MLNDKIKEVRESLGLSRKELAEEQGLSEKTIAAIEAGNRIPQITLLRYLAYKSNISMHLP